jgi:hypothetical protein
MFVTKKSLPRRTVLRGLGTAVALPWLDSMVPALTSAAGRTLRLGAIYAPNGMNMAHWTPAAEGAAYTPSPILEPLTPYRDRVLVLSGLSNKEADVKKGDGGGDHGRGQAAFLTGAHAKPTTGPDVECGISMDQIAAQELGKQTQFASLEFALEAGEMNGCDTSCSYFTSIAWRNPTTPLPMEADPRAVFERLFGTSGSTDPAARLERTKRDRSILDGVLEEAARLQKSLGADDRRRIGAYLESVRDVERRIQMAQQQSARELPAIEQPAGAPASFEEYGTLMFDLMALAYQTDLTRVATFMIGREESSRTYPDIGVPEPHHPISHHQNRAEPLEKLAKINALHMRLFAHFLERLKSTPDGDGSLLDNSMLIYGSGLSNSDVHYHHDLPILLAGGGGGRIKSGRHVKYPVETPLANLHVTVLDTMGVPVERLGDSSGRLNLGA